MKLFSSSSFSLLAAILTTVSSADAALSFSAGYAGTTYHTDGNVNGIVSYDWGSDGALYYSTADSSSMSAGVFRHDSSGTTTIRAASSTFAGATLVAIGSSIYYNDSTFANDQRIYQYSVGTGSTTVATVTNYALATDGTYLYTTGGDFAETRMTQYLNGIYGGTIDLGGVAGASGPMTFDAAGNLFYAPGYGELEIYRWTALEVAAAMAGTTPLSADGHLWVDYESSFPTAGGATSMLTDADGNLIVTLTNFTDPSALVRFSPDGSSHETIATSFDRLGELRMHEGNLYVSDGNSIVQIIPEPSSFLLSLVACGACLGIRRRR